jgi:hypothetical protein
MNTSAPTNIVGEFIGVCEARQLTSPHLKKAALMFDRIAVIDLDNIIFVIEQSHPDEGLSQYMDELRWLSEQGIIYEPKAATFDFAKDKALFEESIKLRTDAEAFVRNGATNTDDMLALQRREATLKARRMSIQMRTQEGLDAVPVLQMAGAVEHSFGAGKEQVLDITVHKVPQPDELTSWENILNYKNDPQTQKQFLLLRRWINRIARGDLDRNEIAIELETSLNEYRDHMKVHKIKAKQGVFRTVIATGLDVLADLTTFKWGKAADLLFSLNERKIQLMEAELHAPGKELAYFVSAEDRFASGQ